MIQLFGKPKQVVEERTVSGIRFTLTKKRVKTLRITVKKPDGDVAVTAPLGYGDAEIDGFVAKKADWIRKNREKLRDRPAQARMALAYETGDVLTVFGKPHQLNVIEDAERKRASVSVSPGVITLIVPEGTDREKREKAVIGMYKRLLEETAGAVLEKWEAAVGARCSSWHTRYMKSRWGSCSSKGVICLNVRLAEKDPAALDYVALHEVAHLLEMNHGPRFKAILTKHMPDWKEKKKLLD